MYLICCTGDNYKFTKISIEYNYKYGAQLPVTVYSKLFFGDQNWKNPRRKEYMFALATYRPTIATVLDLEYTNQYSEVMSWAEEASQYVEYVCIIPKVDGIISKIPRKINNKTVILGFSTPTKYGATKVSIDQFYGWPVHLLGGNPYQQVALCKKLKSDLFSVDCNFHLRMANVSCQFFTMYPNYMAKNRDWPTIKEADGKKFEGNCRIEAFKRSCENIISFWRFHDFRIII